MLNYYFKECSVKDCEGINSISQHVSSAYDTIYYKHALTHVEVLLLYLLITKLFALSGGESKRNKGNQEYKRIFETWR